ncbi:MAG: NAD(P)-dependent glycerol-3-phosphate dehydrogenase [Candidatus Omnitrophica bacterium]|nr:NAD(P)-dependent glycerol-3-phosphate dehydrogenase [Candidatus Omnitrophota bacterium]
MAKAYKVSVLGDGGWGTALALVSNRRGNPTLLWSVFPDYVKVLREKRENEKFLPGISLPKSLEITASIKEAISFGDVLVMAIPTQFLRNVLHKLKELDLSKKFIVSVAKGIEKKTHLRPSEIIESVLGKQRLVVLAGPSHAEEVARNIPTLVVSASKDEKLAEEIHNALGDRFFRVYIQNDVVGSELGGSLKNVVAIAAGICDGIGFGDNTKSGLLTRGLLEMVKLGVRLGANPNTFFGLSGVGDLMTTCFSKHGRNLRVGRELGQGKKIGDILSGMEMVAEGVDTSAAVYELALRVGVELPIMGEVYKILFEGKDCSRAVVDLLSRDAREEWKQY